MIRFSLLSLRSGLDLPSTVIFVILSVISDTKFTVLSVIPQHFVSGRIFVRLMICISGVMGIWQLIDNLRHFRKGIFLQFCQLRMQRYYLRHFFTGELAGNF